MLGKENFKETLSMLLMRRTHTLAYPSDVGTFPREVHGNRNCSRKLGAFVKCQAIRFKSLSTSTFDEGNK